MEARRAPICMGRWRPAARAAARGAARTAACTRPASFARAAAAGGRARRAAPAPHALAPPSSPAAPPQGFCRPAASAGRPARQAYLGVGQGDVPGATVQRPGDDAAPAHGAGGFHDVDGGFLEAAPPGAGPGAGAADGGGFSDGDGATPRGGGRESAAQAAARAAFGAERDDGFYSSDEELRSAPSASTSATSAAAAGRLKARPHRLCVGMDVHRGCRAACLPGATCRTLQQRANAGGALRSVQVACSMSICRCGQPFHALRLGLPDEC